MLSPFSDARTIEVLDQDGGRYGFLVLVLHGLAAVVRVPRVLGHEVATEASFDEVRDHLVARLRDLTEGQRIAFHDLRQASPDRQKEAMTPTAPDEAVPNER